MAASISTYSIQSQNKSPETKIKKAQFGDGYSQITIDGINYDRENISLQFIPMDSTSTSALELILLNSVNGTSNMILFTPHGDSTAKYYIASDVKNDTLARDKYQISCMLERQFPIV